MNLPIIIFILPLLSTIICALLIILRDKNKAGTISSTIISISALLSIFCYLKLNEFAGNYNIYSWIKLGNLNINFSVFYDPLTAIMFLVVNSVSAIVHIFSIGYMEKDLYKQDFFVVILIYLCNVNISKCK